MENHENKRNEMNQSSYHKLSYKEALELLEKSNFKKELEGTMFTDTITKNEHRICNIIIMPFGNNMFGQFKEKVCVHKMSFQDAAKSMNNELGDEFKHWCLEAVLSNCNGGLFESQRLDWIIYCKNA